MVIKKNKNGTFDLQGMTAGKLIAIHAAVDLLEKQGNATTVLKDVRDIIKNNKDYQEAIK